MEAACIVKNVEKYHDPVHVASRMIGSKIQKCVRKVHYKMLLKLLSTT